MAQSQSIPEARTRIGRAIRGVDEGRTSREEHRRQGNWLRDVILGGQDGLVNILGIVLGVIAAGGSTTVLLVTGIAAAITELISKGAVGYTSTQSERDYYRAAQERERREVENDPDQERDEVREIYAAKGFDGELPPSSCWIAPPRW